MCGKKSLHSISGILAAMVLATVSATAGEMITTLAGNGLNMDFANTNPLLHTLVEPSSVAVEGSDLYIADEGTSRILKVTAGVISVIAGTGVPGFSGDGGPAINAQLNQPAAIAVAAGVVYIADTQNHRIRKIQGGMISTIAGDGATDACGNGMFDADSLNRPEGIFVQGLVYIADTGNNCIRTVSTTGGPISMFAGQGGIAGNADNVNPLMATFSQPSGLFVDGSSSVWICDTGNHRLRLVDMGGSLSHVAGSTGGQSGFVDGTSAGGHRLHNPTGIVVVSFNEIYITDEENHAIRMINGSTGAITTVTGAPPPAAPQSGFAGDGGLPAGARFDEPTAITITASNDLIIADHKNNRIRKFNKMGPGNNVSTIAGNGTGGLAGGPLATQAALRLPHAVYVVPSTNEVYICDTDNHRVVKIDANNNLVTVAGNGTPGFSVGGTNAAEALLNSPRGIFVAPDGDIFISDTGNDCVRVIRFATQKIFTVAGVPGSPGFGGDGGLADVALLDEPTGLCGHPGGGLLVCDTGNRRIRRIAEGQIALFAGNGNEGLGGDGGQATLAEFCDISSVHSDADGNVVVSDEGNHTVRLIKPDGVISRIAGTGLRGLAADGADAETAALNIPRGAVITPSKEVYIVEHGNHRVIVIDPVNKKVRSIAGTGVPGYSDDLTPVDAKTAQLRFPLGISGSKLGLVIADTGNGRIRRIFNQGIAIPSIEVKPEQQFVNRPITFLATVPVDPSGNNVFINWDFGDGVVGSGNPVTHTYTTRGKYTIMANVGNGLEFNQPLTKMIFVLGPPSQAMGKKNVGIGKAAKNPLNNLQITLNDSDGGVIELLISQVSAGASSRAIVSADTTFEGTATRSADTSGNSPDGTTVVDQFTDSGITVATTTVTDENGGTTKGRKTVVVGDEETGSEDTTVQNLTPPTSSTLSLKKITGKFTFSDNSLTTGKSDQVTFSGTFKMPAGLILANEQQVDIAVGNVLDQIKIDSKGKGKTPSLNSRIKKLKVKYPKLAKASNGITVGDEDAQIDVTFSIANLDLAGFDTEGVAITNTAAATASQTLNIQLGMVLSGVPYEGTATATYKSKVKKSKDGSTPTNADSGTLSGSTRSN